jgi:hypothetical protein
MKQRTLTQTTSAAPATRPMWSLTLPSWATAPRGRRGSGARNLHRDRPGPQMWTCARCGERRQSAAEAGVHIQAAHGFPRA